MYWAAIMYGSTFHSSDLPRVQHHREKRPTSYDDDESEDENDPRRVVSGYHSMLAVVSRRAMEMSASPRLLMPAVEARRSGWQERRPCLLPRSAARCVAPSALSARKCRQTLGPPHPTSAYLIPKRLNCSVFSSPQAGSVVPPPGNSSSATLTRARPHKSSRMMVWVHKQLSLCVIAFQITLLPAPWGRLRLGEVNFVPPASKRPPESPNSRQSTVLPPTSTLICVLSSDPRALLIDPFEIERRGHHRPTPVAWPS